MRGTLIILALTLFGFASSCFGQQQRPVVGGKVRSTDTLMSFSFPRLMVINKSTSNGVLGKTNGSFQIQAKVGDTLMVAAEGYETRQIRLRDTLVYQQGISVYLRPLEIELPIHTVAAVRELEELEEDRRDLNFEIPELVTGIEVVQSPITALYQRFSKRGKERIKYATLMHEQKKKEILKELFVHYIHGDIIYLDDSEFEDFIAFLNLRDEFLRTVSQYDLIIYIKMRYQKYRMFHPEKVHEEE